jgi:hypothetical protein
MIPKNATHTVDSSHPPARGQLSWLGPLVTVGLLLLGCVALSAFQCQTRGCSPSTSSLTGANLLPSEAFRATMQGEIADVWIEIGDTGVFTPTTAAGGTAVQTDDGQTISYLDDLATKGYIAIRVPHAPPTYTSSNLIPGNSGEPNAVQFSYYSPPTATTQTTVPVSVTRRADLESIVNAHYAIADGQSHWEVWWLPAGEKFPIPDQPFRLQADEWPPPLALAFQIDFGGGANARDCAGCPIEALVYNGYVFVGPYPFALRYIDTTIHEPLAAFGPHCGHHVDSLAPTILQYITPTVPFTHVHCLENWDTVTRTFTINASSSQEWDYAYYWQGAEVGATLNPAGDLPFTVDVGPLPNDWEPGCLGLLAVYTPTIAVTDTLRETFIVTATSVVSPTTVWAEAVSVALAPGYQLDESGGGGFEVYLPLVLRQ